MSSMLQIRASQDDHKTYRRQMHLLWTEGEFLDAEIGISGRRIHGHKVILTANSVFLKHELHGSDAVSLDHLDYDAVSKLVEYFYLGEFEIGMTDAQNVFRAVTYLGVESLHAKICQYVVENLHVENCLDWFHFACELDMSEVCRRARQIMSQELGAVVQTQAFLELTDERMMEYLYQEASGAHGDYVVEAAFRWVAHDISGRLGVMDDVLGRLSEWRCSAGMLRYIWETYGEDLITNFTGMKAFNAALLVHFPPRPN